MVSTRQIVVCGSYLMGKKTKKWVKWVTGGQSLYTKCCCDCPIFWRMFAPSPPLFSNILAFFFSILLGLERTCQYLAVYLKFTSLYHSKFFNFECPKCSKYLFSKYFSVIVFYFASFDMKLRFLRSNWYISDYNFRYLEFTIPNFGGFGENIDFS